MGESQVALTYSYSMEDMEVEICNSEIYGVSCEVESEESGPSHEAVCFS